MTTSLDHIIQTNSIILFDAHCVLTIVNGDFIEFVENIYFLIPE
jgi:hypothetical protein